ncbi:MAG: 16S rRNA processing protein RimM [Flavobacteriales bacterium]|nr:16S rRNA processing protein RimM [Flavobacteriales bacterium]|tara:strand:- start:13879 stop:14418 length:540 start_codon:yes stop_codon:yes gene_type:complete
MKVDDCFYLGYISKAIGNKGELAFKLDVDSPSSYEGLDAVFIQMQRQDKQLVPFFIEESKIQNNQLLRCKIEGVDNQADAKSLIGKSLFLPIEALPKLEGNQFYFHEIIGFEVIDQERGSIGKVDKVLEFSTSNLLSIPHANTEILIPINDETIVEVNRDQRTLKVKTTEGLIDLYLES